MASDHLRLSPSTINLYCDCPRCFYLELKKLSSRPRGIFPSLPIGIDRTLKIYFERFRTEGKLPPELSGTINAKLATGLPKQLKYVDEGLSADLRGNLDECLEFPDGTFAPLDFKTRASKTDKLITAYQNQLDIYTFLLEKSGYRTRKVGYLVYYFPESVEGGDFKFGIDIKEIATSMEAGYALFKKAVDLLRSDNVPVSAPECEYCNFEKSRNML